MVKSAVRSFAVLAIVLAGAAAASAQGTKDEVQTVAGSGKPGLRDGAAASATFLFPAGIAVARDGSIFVSDQDGQRIRKLSRGYVSTVAGSGAIEPDKLSVVGGYVDGPASQARFNEPAGLAISADGALYIADSRNHCIRKLDRGIVSTIVGLCGYGPGFEHPSGVDGKAGDTARLMDPRALAFDRSGNLYIADFGGGLRKLSPDGTLTTIALKSTVNKRFMGIAIDPVDGTVSASAVDQVVAYYPATQTDEAYGTSLAEGDRQFGSPDALAALDHREYIFADPSANNMRYLRLPVPPYSNTTFTRAIAGGVLERQADNAGYRDGHLGDARFYDPAAVALRGRVAYVADAGNHRIRLIHIPHTMVSAGGPSDAITTDGKHFEIVYIGSSSSFYDALGDDSICGQIEARLNASGRAPKPVRCQHVRIDGVLIPAMRDYIANYLLPSNVQMIIVQESPASGDVEHQSRFKAEMQGLHDIFSPTNTKLVMVWAYVAAELNGAEAFVLRERNTDFRDTPKGASDFHKYAILPLQPLVRAIGIAQYDLFDDLMKYEVAGTNGPLFNTNGEGHPGSRANIFNGAHIADFILSLPPSKSGLHPKS